MPLDNNPPLMPLWHLPVETARRIRVDSSFGFHRQNITMEPTTTMLFENPEVLIEAVERLGNWHSVGVQGLVDDGEVGSMRANCWSPELAEIIWHRRLKHMLTEDEQMSAFTSTDWWEPKLGRTYNRWSPIGVSPLMRFMRYRQGGQHYAHYDASYDYPNDHRRTLASMVIYLNTVTEGGATRMVEDGQGHIPIYGRYHGDWARPVKDYEVISEFKPRAGRALMFPHRMCHDVEPYQGLSRYIIRTDIVYWPTEVPRDE